MYKYKHRRLFVGNRKPSGRGKPAAPAATSRGALDWRKRGRRFSLSPRERAGVRGKIAPPRFSSSNQFLDYVSFHVGQTEIAAGITECQLLVVETEQLQNGRV